MMCFLKYLSQTKVLICVLADLLQNSALPDQAHSREGLVAGQSLVQYCGKRSLLKRQHVFVPRNTKGREAEQLSVSIV